MSSKTCGQFFVRGDGYAPCRTGHPIFQCPAGKNPKSGGTLVGTRLCLQSLVCYTLVPADAEKGLREAPASTCSAAEGCADGHGSWRFLPTQRRLAEEPMVYVLPPCRSSVFPISRKANDQRLCFPRLPASVPGFSIAVL